MSDATSTEAPEVETFRGYRKDHQTEPWSVNGRGPTIMHRLTLSAVVDSQTVAVSWAAPEWEIEIAESAGLDLIALGFDMLADKLDHALGRWAE